MSGPAIQVENIGKQYKLGLREKADRSFREAVTDCFTAPLRRLRHLSEKPADDTLFWALHDVDFEVQPGEVVGIIGRNGAGKSTLLKILSRITEPTTGQALIRGRVRSLLEVGTGFHPELTGRENIYLNGAILGMKKTEIDRKFDEIVAFAEVDRFLDTPVKRYSSGMYVRLAFAVAAHLEPEILLVDEVLAVGDAQFQKKCLGKMSDVASAGRTIIFVSHNMAAIERLCRSCILLHGGRLRKIGQPHEVIRQYLDAIFTHVSATPLADRTDRRGSGLIRFTRFVVENAATGQPVDVLRSGEDYVFVFEYECRHGRAVRKVDTGFSVADEFGRSMFVLYNSFTDGPFATVPERGQFRCRVARLPLAPGQYAVGGRIVAGNDEADYPGVIGTLAVAEGDFYNTGRLGLPDHSPFLVDGQWSVTGENP